MEVRAGPEARALRPGVGSARAAQPRRREQPARAAALRGTLANDARAGTPHRHDGRRPQTLPADLLERLGALGYVSGDRLDDGDVRAPIRRTRSSSSGAPTKACASGILALNRRDYAAAARAFEELIGSGIESFEAHLYLARSLAGHEARRSRRRAFRAGRAARAAARRSVDGLGRRASRRPMDRSPRSRSFARAGNKTRSSAAARASSTRDLCLRLRRPDEAMAAFKAALPLLPDDASIRQRLGELQRDLGQIDAALASLRDAVAVDPTNASAWNALGMTLGGNGTSRRSRRGLSHGDRARRHRSSLLSSISGSALVRQGRGPEARPYFEKTLQLAPDFGPAREELRKLRRPERANREAPAHTAQTAGSAGAGARHASRVPSHRRWPRSACAVCSSPAGPSSSGRSPACGCCGPKRPAESPARVARHGACRSSRLLSLRRRADAAHRRAGGVRPAIRAGDDRRAAHAAGALVADDRDVSRLARRARQRRLLPGRRSAHARRGPARQGLSNRRLRRRVRARSALGHRAGLRPLLRRLRSRPVRRTPRRWT